MSLRGGLANRLRTVLGFKLVASKNAGSEVLVCWRDTPPCPGLFLNLFMPIEGVKFIVEAECSKLIRLAKQKQLSTADSEGIIAFTGQNTIKAITKQFGSKKQATDVTINKLYRLIRLLPKLEQQIAQFVESNQLQDCIGLHIRRTDHSHMAQTKNRFTSDDEFLKLMRKERENRLVHPHTHCFRSFLL